MVWNSSGFSMAVVSLFWICFNVVIPCMYSLSRYVWDFFLAFSGRLGYDGLDFYACSNGVFLDGDARFVVVTCISYFISSRKSILAMGDLVHACCLNLVRCSERPYLAVMYLVNPW